MSGAPVTFLMIRSIKHDPVGLEANSHFKEHFPAAKGGPHENQEPETAPTFYEHLHKTIHKYLGLPVPFSQGTKPSFGPQTFSRGVSALAKIA